MRNPSERRISMQAAIRDNSEAALMSKYLAGDERAFCELFKRLAPAIHRFFLRKFGDPELADDMQQTAFLKLLKGCGAYQEGEPVRPWLFTIASRLRVDELRRRKAQQRKLAALAMCCQSHAETRPSFEAEHSLAAAVCKAIDDLPDSQRDVVKLHRFDGLTFREIANKLDVSEAAVKLRASRAYGKLRKTLAPLRD
jgi:RNA polymerase sigma-70 factor (ECF subfamily)